MKLDLRSMLSGELRSLDVNFSLVPEDHAQDRSSSLWGVCFSTPLNVTGQITNTAGYMNMVLHMSIDYVAPCSRCLTDVPGTYTFDLEKTVAPRSMLTDLEEDKLDDYAIVEDGFLDIDALLLELLDLDFPSKILCKEDCLGLCFLCGRDLNDGECGCNRKGTDERLAPLAAILEQMKAESNEDKN